jgi:hypothetical protein
LDWSWAEIQRSARSLSTRAATALGVLASHRWFLAALTALAVALVLPSARIGLCCDDFVLLGILSGSSPLRDVYPSRLDIFNFFDGSPERMRRLLDLGLLPWWTFPGVREAFWRPVTALTHWLDYAAWRDLPVLMHVQSVFWFSALVVTAALTYRRLMGRGSASALAALLYAVDDGHAASIMFVSGRNTMLGALFGTLTLLVHDRWRRAGWRGGAVMAPACLGLALLSSEGAVATVAYLFAHAVFLDRGGWRRGLPALLPHGAVVAAWHLLYTGLGYGVLGAAPVYLNPLREPLQFARALATKGPIFLLAQWIGPPSETFPHLPPGAAAARWLGALLVMSVLGVLLAPLLKRDRVARFWSLGQVLAVVPFCAANPHDRYLFFVGLGAMGLIGQFLCGLLGQEPWRPPGRVWRWPATALACVLGAIHLVASPLQLGSSVMKAEDSAERASDTIPADPAMRRQLVVIAYVPSAVAVSYSFFIRTVKGQPIPARTRVLAAEEGPISVYRADARTLRVRWEGRRERVFRARENPMTPGERVRLTGTDIEVTALTEDGWPAEATFRFDADLEDPSLRWLRWAPLDGRGGFVSFRPPSVGETVVLP